MEPKTIEKINLDNGLTLEILDASHKVAGDRWMVKLVACMDIPVMQKWFDGSCELPASLEKLRAGLGDVVRFEFQNQRFFVDNIDKEAVFGQMQGNLVSGKLKYYSHPDFAARFICKEFKSYQERTMRETQAKSQI